MGPSTNLTADRLRPSSAAIRLGSCPCARILRACECQAIGRFMPPLAVSREGRAARARRPRRARSSASPPAPPGVTKELSEDDLSRLRSSGGHRWRLREDAWRARRRSRTAASMWMRRWPSRRWKGYRGASSGSIEQIAGSGGGRPGASLLSPRGSPAGWIRTPSNSGIPSRFKLATAC